MPEHTIIRTFGAGILGIIRQLGLPSRRKKHRAANCPRLMNPTLSRSQVIVMNDHVAQCIWSRCTARRWRLAAVIAAVFAFLAALLAPPVSAADEANKGNGLVAHWTFAGDARDRSGHNRHTENHGVDADAVGPSGRKGTAARFDGVADFLEVPADKAPDFGSSDFTISTWIETDGRCDDVLGDIVSKFDPQTRRGFNFSLMNYAGVSCNQSNSRNIHFGIDDGSPSPQWVDCGRPGNNLFVFALTVFQGDLYAGTFETGKDETGHVYRYGNGTMWIDCGSPDGANSVMSLCVYQGRLYAGTGRYNAKGSALAESPNQHPGGRVYRYDGEKKWTDCGRLGEANEAFAMAVYDDKLYAIPLYSMGLFRYDGEKAWTDLGNPGKRLMALGPYNGGLYLTGNGGGVYRFTASGKFTHVGDQPETTQVYSIAIYNGLMHVGTWPKARVFRFDGKENNHVWNDTGRLGDELEVMGMAVYNGKLYAGSLPLAKVFRYDEGTAWADTGQLDFTPDVRYRRAWSMAVFQGKLFCGTLPSGHVHSLEVGTNVTYDRELPPGWQHLAAVRNKESLRLYLNGRQVAESKAAAEANAVEPTTALNIANAAPLKIGFGAHDYFKGALSDLRLYDRALDAGEIGQLATMHVPTPVDEEALLFTPAGFNKPGNAIIATGDNLGHLKLTVIDAETNAPTPCRINVVGPDGNYYQPNQNYLTAFALTGEWPKTGMGNRQGKAPFRYYGRSFYSWGEADVDVPPGNVRIEVYKGLEYRPVSITTTIAAAQMQSIPITIEHTLDMTQEKYYSGDPHIHIARADDRDEGIILDLMQAEGIHYGSILAYNDPPGPYTAAMKTLAMPQYRGLGAKSVRERDGFFIMSGQEYRSSHFGHLNLFLRDDLVRKEESLNLDDSPPYGTIGRETRKAGGYAIYAHGGYAQSIYADMVQDDVNAVELLQFGVYRGIGLADWYHMLNAGFRFPAVGACDFPACRKLGDCQTYVYSPQRPSFPEWLEAAAQGRSFVTTGPMVMLDVDGQPPGSQIRLDDRLRTVKVSVTIAADAAPVTDVELIVNGRVIDRQRPGIEADSRDKRRFTWSRPVEIADSAWMAVRAYSRSPAGNPDGEAHTNPAYVIVDGKAPFNKDSVDVLIARLDGQIDAQKKRDFQHKAEVITYYERARDILVKLREHGAIPTDATPVKMFGDDPSLAIDPSQRQHTDEELKAFLKPVPGRSSREALKSFETHPDFEMQLVAAEPDVLDPIAAAFDADGNLYVCEMRDYPYFPKKGDDPIGTVRLLRDTNGDGVMDESHVFADKLLWAGGVAPYKRGVFVATPPDIWYMQDTDGDFRADVRKKVFTGFGVQNQQAMLNNLKMGLDHLIYGSTAGNGGLIRPGDKPSAQPVSVEHRDFRFDPDTLAFESITGTQQFGNTFDDWGNRFVCSQSQPLLQIVLPQHYLARNPYLAVPQAIENLAPEPVPIFRISPLERWREIRSSRRIAHGERSAQSSGASHHVVDAGAGVTIYRGGAYPPEFYGQSFVGDAQNNLVHRRSLTPAGVIFKSARADENTEFVRSSDNWFRPVNFVNAPDGTMYVLDMNREILESIHIPLDVLKFLDLKRGRDTGRIYRIAPKGFKSPSPPRLENAPAAELLAALDSPHGWYRETAHRLIYERQDKSLVAPLRELARSAQRPQTRLHALWSLKGLGALADEDILAGLADPVAPLRENAVLLAESRIDASAAILTRLLDMTGDPDPRVRFQLAFMLGETNDPRAVAALASIARRDAADQRIRTAVLSSAAETADALFDALAADRSFLQGEPGKAMLVDLARVVGARHVSDKVDQLLAAVAAIANDGERAPAQQFVAALADGMKQSGVHFDARAVHATAAAALLKSLLDEARATSADTGAEADLRASAIALLGCFELVETKDTLVPLLDPREPAEVQTAAIAALAGYADPHVPEELLSAYKTSVPDVRTRIAEALLSRDDWTLLLLTSAAEGRIDVAGIDASRRQLLLKHAKQQIREDAARVFGGATTAARGDVVAEFKKSLSLKSDANRGAVVFERECMVCHRIGTRGFAIGPDLTSTASAEPEALLTHILDPNRYLLPQFTQYVVVDVTGRSHTGIVTANTPTSITLKREKDVTDVILKGNIDEMTATDKSLMPEGFEKKLTQQEMADLIAFLSASRNASASATTPARLDIGTHPGLAEPD